MPARPAALRLAVLNINSAQIITLNISWDALSNESCAATLQYSVNISLAHSGSAPFASLVLGSHMLVTVDGRVVPLVPVSVQLPVNTNKTSVLTVDVVAETAAGSSDVVCCVHKEEVRIFSSAFSVYHTHNLSLSYTVSLCYSFSRLTASAFVSLSLSRSLYLPPPKSFLLGT